MIDEREGVNFDFSPIFDEYREDVEAVKILDDEPEREKKLDKKRFVGGEGVETLDGDYDHVMTLVEKQLVGGTEERTDHALKVDHLVNKLDEREEWYRTTVAFETSELAWIQLKRTQFLTCRFGC